MVIVILVGAVGYFVFSRNSVPTPIITQPSQQTPPPTNNTGATQPPSSTSASYEEKIAACYPKNEGSSASQPLMNNSVQHVVETTRRFVNLPKDLYPKNIGSYFSTVSGNATAGWISNGGLPGEGLDATPECWSTYYEFDGNGEVDLKVKSTVKGAPDFFVRFIVGPTQ